MKFYKIPRPVPTKIMIQDKARENVWNNYEKGGSPECAPQLVITVKFCFL